MPKLANVHECNNDVKQSLDSPNISPETHENVNANAPHSPMFIKSRIRNNRQAAVLSILTDTGAKSNLISLSSLALLGNQQPKLRRAPIKLSGANGSELNTLGIVSLFVKLGDVEHLLDFYVINNLCTTAIIGSHDLSKLKATIDCANNVIRFGDGPPIRLQNASVTVPIVNNSDITLMPGNHAIVSCKSRDKVNVRGSHFASRHEHSPYQLIDSIVDVNGHSQFTVCIYNPKNTVVKIPKDTNIGYLSPVTPNCSLYLIDESDIEAILDDIDCDEILFPVQSGKGNGKKKTIKKPSFSRPIDKLDNLTDEEIIRAQIRYNGKLLSDVEREYLIKIVLKYKHAFSLRGELGKSNSLIYHIRLKPDAEHFYRQPFRSSDHEKELMRKEITKLIKLGIVEVSSKNYVPYCSPSMLVAKSDNSARLISDFRILNSCTKVDHYVFPRLDEILTRIGKMRPMYFGQFDLCDSFYQIPLSEESKELTTFTTESHKLYNYLWLPQGLHNSPAALAKLTDNVFGQLDFLITYADDMVLLGQSKEAYFQNLEKFLQCVVSDNLKLNLRKSVLFDDHCVFLGHHIAKGAIRPLPKHLEAIKKLSSPKDKASLKRLLGSLNWLKKYIKCYSQKTHDLYQLLRKDQEYIWESRHENAYQNIKEFLTTDPVIKLPTGLGQYSLFCDGSCTGLGATLLETVDGQSHVIGYASRATTSAEQKCSVTELELSAIAFALKAFRFCYIPLVRLTSTLTIIQLSI